MSEFIILCNEQEIYCDSVAYYCDGSVVKIDVVYNTTAFTDVSYDSTNYINVLYFDYLFLLDSDSKFLLESDGLYLRCRGDTVNDNVRY